MKRIFSSFLVLLLIVSALSVPALAASRDNGISPHASPTLASYDAIASKGASGRLDIDASVISSDGSATSIGVEKIVIYKANGSRVTTVYGSTSNGLKGSGPAFACTYSYYGTAGTSYYAVVTVFAKTSTASDSKSVTTRTIQV